MASGPTTDHGRRTMMFAEPGGGSWAEDTAAALEAFLFISYLRWDVEIRLFELGISADTPAKDGYRWGAAGLSRDTNPYDPFDVRARTWDEGWSEGRDSLETELSEGR